MTIPPRMIGNLVRATEEVFETMVFKSVSAQEPIADESFRPVSNVVASVAFAGYRCGLVAFHSSTGAARDIAGAMLGIPPASVNGEMPDAIGEIANMIAGTLRTKMAEVEPAWAIAVPTVTIGSDFSTKYPTDVTRLLLPFSMEGQSIFVELILTGR